VGVFDSHKMKRNITYRQRQETQFGLHNSELWRSVTFYHILVRNI